MWIIQGQYQGKHRKERVRKLYCVSPLLIIHCHQCLRTWIDGCSNISSFLLSFISCVGSPPHSPCSTCYYTFIVYFVAYTKSYFLHITLVLAFSKVMHDFPLLCFVFSPYFILFSTFNYILILFSF